MKNNTCCKHDANDMTECEFIEIRRQRENKFMTIFFILLAFMVLGWACNVLAGKLTSFNDHVQKSFVIAGGRR